MTSLQQTADGGYIIGGYSDSPSSFEKSGNSKGSYDYWIIKMESEICPTPATPTISPVSASNAPVLVNTTFQMEATTPDNNLTNTTWDWGDGTTTPGTLNGTTISGSHTYTTPGLYTLTLTVENACGGTSQSTYQYVVVYDPAAGFLTGGGWINSPPGAYAANPSLTGKINYGFVCKYKKGSTVPDGNTEFDFKVGNLNFKSTSYDWLVIAGAKAQFKGNGTINGSGNYSFMLTAIDGHIDGGGGTDKFRIRIMGNSGLVYDNNVGSAEGTGDNASPATALGGGSIVIHKNDNKKAREGFGAELVVTMSDYLILNNYPNPSNGKVTFEFTLPQTGEYQLDLLDLKGNQVQAVKQGTARAGETQRVICRKAKPRRDFTLRA